MVFLWLTCATGLPLVFSEEIEQWMNPTAYAVLPPDTPRVNLDRLTDRSLQMFPGQIVTSVSIDPDAPQIIIGLAPDWSAFRTDFSTRHFLRFDARTGALLQQLQPFGKIDLLTVLLSLHRDLFAGLPGGLFMAAMALLFVAALVSGLVLYGPFMRKLDFGAVRSDRSRRIRWLDLHNLLGVVTVMWALVVGVTGAMNEISGPLFALWQRQDVAAMVAPWRQETPPAAHELSSVEDAAQTAQRALPGMAVVSILYPGGDFGSPHHYLMFARGATPLKRQLFSPVLVDARTGDLTTVLSMPWYLQALALSRPLHFGDYGGLPLKIIWAILDIATMIVLGSGIYLWLSRRKTDLETMPDERDAGLGVIE